MATEDQPTQKKERGERLVTRNDYIVCGLISLLVGTSNAARDGLYLRADPVGFIAFLLGTFAAVLIFWVCVRGIYRWLTKKKPAPPPVA